MLSLTRQERQVILFLTTIALIGLGIDFLAKKYSTIKAIVCLNPNISKVNLNEADRETLVSLPGIGEKLAQRILEYRNKNGDFTNIEELKKVKGVRDYQYSKLKDLLFVK